MAVSLISFSVPVFKLWGTQLPHCFLRLAQGERLKTINKNQTTVPKSKRFCQHNTEEHPSVREHSAGPGFCHNIWSHAEFCKCTWESKSLPREYQAQPDLHSQQGSQRMPEKLPLLMMHLRCTETHLSAALGAIKRGSYSYLHSPLLKL